MSQPMSTSSRYNGLVLRPLGNDAAHPDRPLPDDAVLRAVTALIDTFTANLSANEADAVASYYYKTVRPDLAKGSQTVDAFLALQSSDLAGMAQTALATLESSAPADKLAQLTVVLRLLTTTLGTMALCGTGFKRMVPFVDLDRTDRELALRRMADSYLSPIRAIFKTFMAISALSVYGHSVDVIGDSSATASPLWEGIGYPGPHPGIDRPSPDSIWRPSFLPVPLACFDQHRSDAGRAAVNDADLPVLSYDVVVIGSGAGGGIVAAELSKAGHSVLLLDKARYTHTTDLPKSEAQAYKLLYENSAGLFTEDGGLEIIAGTAWGGGTQINWSASLVPPQSLRKEWAEKYRLPFFASAQFQKSVDAVTSRAGVGTSAVRHNPSNQLLLDGCRALGFDNDTIPQNTAGKHHSCGGCCLGCPTAEKQGTLPTWIRDASDAGCHFIDAAYAEHVIHQGGVVQGVVIRVDGGSSSNPSAASVRLRVHAKRVVSSCGAINTPALLLRSKLKNRFIGRNLKLHPVASVFGVFPDKEVDPSQGSIMTAISNQVADLDGNGYGARIEVPAIHTGSFATLLPWRSAADYKRLLLQFPQTMSLISLTRDDDSEGIVFIDSDGKARINWTLSAKDSKHALEGLKTAMHILIAAGATEIYSAQNGVPSFFRPAGMSPAQTLESREFKDFIALMDRKGIQVNSTPLFCAHQMGSARMAPSARYGAVNPCGETFDVRGLYVADTSVFPTASGVNPMMTAMSVAHSIAQFIKADLARDRALNGGPATPARIAKAKL